MASFADVLSAEDAEAIHQYLIARANREIYARRSPAEGELRGREK